MEPRLQARERVVSVLPEVVRVVWVQELVRVGEALREQERRHSQGQRNQVSKSCRASTVYRLHFSIGGCHGCCASCRYS